MSIYGTFTFSNLHPTKKASVSDITATMQIGSKIAQFRAGSYIHSWRDEEDSKKLRITSSGDFGKFTIPADTTSDPKEIYFYAKPSEDRSQRFKYAFTVEEFRKRIASGESVDIKFVVDSEVGKQTFSFAPSSPKDISARLGSNYKWDVQEATKK